MNESEKTIPIEERHRQTIEYVYNALVNHRDNNESLDVDDLIGTLGFALDDYKEY